MWLYDLRADRMPGFQEWNAAYVSSEQVTIKHLAKVPVWNGTLRRWSAVFQDAVYKLKYQMICDYFYGT